ncbi:MAG TPA: BTAD domain-containing putative transcriptional regulator [Candidatus Limnocylindria bacterium]|nr:BTAD domain-containing putative transcriptional regulator [Candidatus Limnocylindria bacterium]
MIELRTLGVTQVRPPGSPDTGVYLQPKRFAVLAYLATARPRGMHRRDSLLVVFWPEESEHRARNALSQTLHAIRRDLGQQVLLSHGHELVGVNEAGLSCDAVEFDEHLERGELEEGLRLYRGEFLRGLLIGQASGFDRWQESEAWRLQRRAWKAAAALADRAEGDGNMVAAMHWLEQAVELLPTDEALLRRLLILTDSMGDRAGALRTYERFADLMREEYGVEPSPETEALVREVRGRRTPLPRPSPVSPIRRPISSIAVLPLENLTGRAEDEYFADGMTEMLTTELSGIGALRVVSRQSVRAFKGSDRPLRDLTDLLGVDAVLEGSVLRAGDRIRVVVQLVRVEPEEHLWADAYDRDVSDVFSMYSEISRAISAEVAAKLTGEEQQGFIQRGNRSVHPVAYDRFLRGVALFGQSQFEEAVEQYGRAIELDPDFAEAHAWMAATLGRIAMVAGPQLAEPMRREVALALEQGPDLQWAHAVLGSWLMLFKYDWQAADAAFQRAMKAKRRDARAHPEYGLFLVGQCRFDQAMALAHEWLDFDPGVGAHDAIGWVQLKRRQFEESTERLEFVIDHWPGYAYTPIWLACNYAFLGRSEEAINLMRRALEAAPGHSILRGYAGAVFGVAGAREDARGILRSFDVIGRGGAYVDPFNLALVHMGLGEHEEALTQLERCAAEGSVQNWIIAPEPFFDDVRQHPRFREVLRRLRLPEWVPPSAPEP